VHAVHGRRAGFVLIGPDSWTQIQNTDLKPNFLVGILIRQTSRARVCKPRPSVYLVLSIVEFHHVGVLGIPNALLVQVLPMLDGGHKGGSIQARDGQSAQAERRRFRELPPCAAYVP
jgi:hypothetical protein